jgi:tetratricopeptide (TPR) repeat protein
MKQRLLIVPVLIAAAAFQLTAGTATRKALVIGNDAYLHANVLINSTNDARDISTALKALGYSVDLSLNATLAQLGQAVALFCQGLVSGDTAVVFYSGHGFQLNGDNYLVPTDFNFATATIGPEQAYPLAMMLQQITGRGATTQIVILDACRNNPFSVSKSTQAGWAEIGVPVGTLIAFGTAPGSTASDNPTEANGLFTKALLAHISSRLVIEEMLKLVAKDTIIASLGLQIPWIASSLTGIFSFNMEANSGALNPTSLSLTDQLSVPSAMAQAQPITSRDRGWGEAGIDPSPADLKSAEILVNQGLLLARQGNYAEATRSLSAALALRPGFSIALRVLGLILSALGRGADSIAEFSRAIDVDPRDYLAYYYRCLATVKRDSSEAARDCEAAIGIAPKFVPAHVGLANALLATGKIDGALSEINNTLTLAPGSAQAHALRAKVFEYLGQHENANKDVAAAVRLSVAVQP